MKSSLNTLLFRSILFCFIFFSLKVYGQTGSCSSPNSPINSYATAAAASAGSHTNRFTPTTTYNTTFSENLFEWVE